MESTPIEQIVDINGAKQDDVGNHKAPRLEKCTQPEDKTEVSANQEENENDDETFFDANDHEEAKSQAN